METAEEPEESDDRVVLEWSLADTNDLLEKMQAKVPKKDTISHTKRIARLDLEGVTVGEHSTEECRAQLLRIMQNVSVGGKMENCMRIMRVSLTFFIVIQSS